MENKVETNTTKPAVTKIVYREKESFAYCGGPSPVERTMLVLTKDTIHFKRSAKMNGWMDSPYTRASEFWTLHMDCSEYEEALDLIAEQPGSQVSGPVTDCDRTYSLTIRYEDGTKTFIRNGLRFIEDEFFRAWMTNLIPSRMGIALFGETDEENE